MGTTSLLSTNTLAKSSGTGLEVYDGWNLELTLIDEETIQFDIHMPDNTWLGLNLGGTNMGRGDDMVRFVAQGNDSAWYDEHLKRRPSEDDEQNLFGSFELIDNEVIFHVQRKLDTGDADDDFLIPADAPFDMAWAVNYETPDKRKKHQVMTNLYGVQLAQPGQPTWGEPIPIQVETDEEESEEEQSNILVEDPTSTPSEAGSDALTVILSSLVIVAVLLS